MFLWIIVAEGFEGHFLLVQFSLGGSVKYNNGIRAETKRANSKNDNFGLKPKLTERDFLAEKKGNFGQNKSVFRIFMAKI